MPYPIKLYISTIAYKAIPTSISNAISTRLNAIWRYPKNAYKAYKTLFRPGKEVQQGTI